MALSGRRALPLRLRGRPRALLLAAAGLSRRAVGVVHDRRHPARVRHAQAVRPILHGGLRPPRVDHGFLAVAAGCPSQDARDEDRLTTTTTHCPLVARTRPQAASLPSSPPSSPFSAASARSASPPSRARRPPSS